MSIIAGTTNNGQGFLCVSAQGNASGYRYRTLSGCFVSFSSKEKIVNN
jgi:hypothetical protein